MKQRALEAGVLSDPYRYVEAGEEFEYPEEMVWAEVVEPEPAPKEPAKKVSKSKDEPADVI